MIALYICAAQF